MRHRRSPSFGSPALALIVAGTVTLGAALGPAAAATAAPVVPAAPQLQAPGPQAPEPQAPGSSGTATVATISSEAPSYKGGTEVRVRGTLLSDDGTAVAGAKVALVVDGNLEQPTHATTDAAGNWAATIPAIWVMGQHHVQVRYAGDAEHAATDAHAPVLVTSRQLPVTVRTSASAQQVRQGDQVTVSGEARIDTGAPLVHGTVFLTVAPDEEPTGKTITDEQGRFSTTFTVPVDAGSWAEPYPGYTVLVHTDELEDWVATSQPLHFTLTGQPAAKPATPTPEPTTGTNIAPAGTGLNSGSGSDGGGAGEVAGRADTSGGPVAGTPANDAPTRLVPDFITWAELGAGGGLLLCIVGAALLSHGRRLRKP